MATIKSVEKFFTSGTEVHVDISGSVNPRSIGGNVHVIHMLETRSCNSEVFVTAAKSDMPAMAQFLSKKPITSFESPAMQLQCLEGITQKKTIVSVSNNFAESTEYPSKLPRPMILKVTE